MKAKQKSPRRLKAGKQHLGDYIYLTRCPFFNPWFGWPYCGTVISALDAKEPVPQAAVVMVRMMISSNMIPNTDPRRHSRHDPAWIPSRRKRDEKDVVLDGRRYRRYMIFIDVGRTR